MKKLLLDKDRVNRLDKDPHQILGVHSLPGGATVVRLYRPDLEELYVEVLGALVLTTPSKMLAGLFEYYTTAIASPEDYRVFYPCGLLAAEPYAFAPAIGELDLYLFGKGVHYRLYEILGARVIYHQGVWGTRFVVWAPLALAVSLVADCNRWNPRIHKMRALGATGLWEIFLPCIGEGEKYKFAIRTESGVLLWKTDPAALAYEMRPDTAAIVARYDEYQWHDQSWMSAKAKKNITESPMIVYELHLGSWRRSENRFLNYRELAHELRTYCEEMGYTHIELLPVMEHPLDESWGYQVTGFFAPTSRFGSMADFQYFVDYLHQGGIAILLDWVPAHFPRDAYSLANFDGSCLFEHANPQQADHPHWKTLIFNYGRTEVSNFLIASALFWVEVLHVDGFRVDAVSSMLYLDYGRHDNDWVPNCYGGNENLEAIEFLKHLNAIIHQRTPGTVMIAEESTAFGGITKPLNEGGLGFDFKWNMGWMHDTLRYFQRDPIYRSFYQHELTFNLLYAFSERFLLPFSHDEVVHCKGSLWQKMSGDPWQKWANLRLLLSYQICQPGKKLIFMGSDWGVESEWNASMGLSWQPLEESLESRFRYFVRKLYHFYRKTEPLWAQDHQIEGFEWVDFQDSTNSIISYLRLSSNERVLCLHNFTPTYFPAYTLRWVFEENELVELFNSDCMIYGGSGQGQNRIFAQHGELTMKVPPLATLIFSMRKSDTIAIANAKQG